MKARTVGEIDPAFVFRSGTVKLIEISFVAGGVDRGDPEAIPVEVDALHMMQIAREIACFLKLCVLYTNYYEHEEQERQKHCSQTISKSPRNNEDCEIRGKSCIRGRRDRRLGTR